MSRVCDRKEDPMNTINKLTISGVYALTESVKAAVLAIAKDSIIDSGDKLATLTVGGIEKPILPGKQELEENSRSKSAKLRVFEKAK